MVPGGSHHPPAVAGGMPGGFTWRRTARTRVSVAEARAGQRSRLQLAPVRLVIARCSVDYVGRLPAHLPSAPRLLIVKADGSVLVHSDGGSYKPLNWMSPPCRLEESTSDSRAGDKGGRALLVTI